MARQEINVVQLFTRFSEVIKMILEAALVLAGENTFAELEKGRKLLLENEGRRQMLAKLLLGRDFVELAQEQGSDDYVTPLLDIQVPEHLQATLAKWRNMATAMDYAGMVAWHVKAGFTLKKHAPKFGPCYEEFRYLQDWNFEDEPTKETIVFWIPRLVTGSTGKNVDEQKKLLADLRMQYELPEHHLTGFGSVALVAGLILAHYKATGEMVPFDGYWTRTDTRDVDGRRLDLHWREGRLRCDGYGWDEGGYAYLGVFALGVELGK